MLNKLLGIPENASVHGAQVDHFLELCHWFMLILFVAWSAFFLYTIYRFHQKRNPKASYHGMKSHFSSHAELGVIIIEAVLVVGFAFPLWNTRVNEYPEGDESAVKVRAIAEQFGWNFHYPGADGVYGKQDVLLISGTNPIGLDRNDPKAKDDIVSRKMRTPINRPVIVDISSKDVIHNFAVKQMRIGQDAIPGLKIPVWFTPNRTGDFEIVCGQLCGAGHGLMKGTLQVTENDEFEKWYQDQSADALERYSEDTTTASIAAK